MTMAPIHENQDPLSQLLEFIAMILLDIFLLKTASSVIKSQVKKYISIIITFRHLFDKFLTVFFLCNTSLRKEHLPYCQKLFSYVRFRGKDRKLVNQKTRLQDSLFH